MTQTSNLNSNAQWLWAGNPGWDLTNSWMQCRRVIDVDEVPESVVFHVTADTRYRLFVNGRRVLDGPVRGFQHHWFYDSVDVAQFLSPGKNVISALVHNLGTGTFSYIHQNCAGFILWGKIGAFDLITDKQWAVRFCPEHLRYQTRTSLQTGWQEFVDARRGDGLWTTLGYDDSHWRTGSQASFRQVGCAPWHELVSRDIPLLREISLRPQVLHSLGSADGLSAVKTTTNVVKDYLESIITWNKAVDSTANEWIIAKTNEAVAWCFDLQREVCATTIIKIKGARGGEVIDCLMAESCNGPAPVILCEESRTQLGHRYICREGDQDFESFFPWGYRFLIVSARGPVDLKLSLEVRHVEYPLVRKGCLHSDPPEYQTIYEMCAHTQQVCMTDAYIDCPGREQAMWWGDAHTQFATSQHLGADDRLITRGLRLMAQQTAPNGLTYGLAPTADQMVILPDFTLRWIETHWQHWWYSGSPELFTENEAAILLALEYFHQQSISKGVLGYDSRYWLFLDWSETFKDGYSTLYNLQYLRTLERASEMLTRINSKAANRIAGRSCGLREQLSKVFWDEQNALPLDGRDWQWNPVKASSLHSRIMAIGLGLWPDYHQKWLQEDILPFIRGPRPIGIDPTSPELSSVESQRALTPYFMQYVFEVILEKGYSVEVVDCIRRWWSSMISRGLVTTEEVWDTISGRGSLCHAWSAHPIQFLSNTLLGIHQTAPSWKTVRFAPIFVGQSARGVVDTPLGPIRSSWERQDKKVKIELCLPAGCCAKLDCPGMESLDLYGSWQGILTAN